MPTFTTHTGPNSREPFLTFSPEDLLREQKESPDSHIDTLFGFNSAVNKKQLNSKRVKTTLNIFFSSRNPYF